MVPKKVSKKASQENVHAGHRQRMRQKFLERGFENMFDYEMLEMLMFYSHPRRNTNPLGHTLIARFGSLPAVFDASAEELMSVEGIGENAAVLIKMIPALAREYSLAKRRKATDFKDMDGVAEYLSAYFLGKNTESVVLLMYNDLDTLIDIKPVCEGSSDHVDIDFKKIVELSSKYNASSVIIAHNHVGRSAKPSQADKDTTLNLTAFLANLGVALKEHIIISDGGCSFVKKSMKKS